MKNQRVKNKQLKNNLEAIYQDINSTKTHNQQVKLLAVTKTHPITAIEAASALGIKCFGENKIQEAEKKAPNLPENTEFHFIGHLQSNKIKKALNIFDVIQTIDSLKLAKKINQHAKTINKRQRIYCQINIGKDPNKTGLTPMETDTQIGEIIKLENLVVEGIMTMLPLGISEEKIRQLYNKTKVFRDKISEQHKTTLELSMGMSNDYKIAIECGSTCVRIGTGLFGAHE